MLKCLKSSGIEGDTPLSEMEESYSTRVVVLGSGQ